MFRPESIILLCLLAVPAAAETPLSDVWCAPGAQIEQGLKTRLGAVKRGEGLRDPDSMMTLWQGRDGGWTLVATYADGRACVVAQGLTWDTLGAPPQG
jgi:hypothetical protein